MTKPKNDKKLSAIDKYIIFSMSCIIVFTVVEIVIFTYTSIEQTALIYCFYAFFGNEVLQLGMIKRLKLSKEQGTQGGNKMQLPTKPADDIDNTGAFG